MIDSPVSVVIPELSILVPCLNEEDNIPSVLEALERLRVEGPIPNLEVLLLDDNSSDNTFARSLQEADKYPLLNVRVLRRPGPRRGYGAIVRFGMAHARGAYVVPVAADMVDPVYLLPDFLKRMRAGGDLVQCSRYLKPGDAATIPFKYKFFQSIWRFLVKTLIGREIPDTTYAFRIFRRADALAYGINSSGFNISPEIFFKTLLRGGRIEYVAEAQGVRQRGVSKFIFKREGPGYAYVLLRAFLHGSGLIHWF